MPPLQFIGRYEILGSIGSGGMGTLLRARDPKIGGRTVAIKLLKEGLDNEEIRRRFMQEANAAGVLEHENIVRIFDVGEQGGEPFIAMEFIDGETLSAWIRRREPAPLTRKLKLIEELCDGLAYAHTFGIVHRDIKPANLMVEKRRGRLKILDFGIAKLADSGITNAGALIGSFNYMSPEQVRGLPIDHRSDIFSVGAVLFELLCYRQAFPGGLGDGVLGRIAEQPAPKLSDVMAGCDPELERVIGRALEKDPGRRYQDLNELHRDLTRVRRRFERDESSEHTYVDRGSEPRATPTPVPGTPRPTPRGGRGTPGAERLARIRAQQIEEHLASAQRAFEGGHYEEAIDLTYRASAIDEHDPRAHELRDRVQAALDDREARRFAAQARAAMGRGELDEAEALVAKAHELKPDLADLAEIGRELTRQRNERAAVAALQRARAGFDAHDWTGVIRAAAEVEHYVPGHEQARQLRWRAQQALDERRRQEAHEQAARHEVAEARQQVAHGDLAGAVARLAAFAPPHPGVTRELDRLRAELAAAEERAQRERERQERVRQAIEAARRAIVHGAIEEARAHAAAAAEAGAEPRLLEGLRTEIDLARQHAEARARRQAQLDTLIAEAQAKLAAGESRGAIIRCDAALRLQPDEPRALDVRQRAQHAIEAEEERRRREAEEARLRQEAEAAERRRLEEEARLQREAEDARRLREAHDDAARESIALARREFDAGYHREALARLAGFTPLHDEVQAALAGMRADLTRLEAEASAAVADARALAHAGRHADAFARLDAFVPVSMPVIAAARSALEAEAQRIADAAERARIDEERQRRAEEDRRARLAQIASLMTSARELSAAGQLAEALAALTEAGRLDPASAEIAELARSVRAQLAEREAAERRARELSALLAEAEGACTAGDLPRARRKLDDARRLDGAAAGIAELEARLQAAEAAEQAAREARRQALEAERAARDRESRIAGLLKKARKARKPQDAVAILEDALALDAAHGETLALLEAKRRDVAAAEQARAADARAKADAQARAEQARLEKQRADERRATEKRAAAAARARPAAAPAAGQEAAIPAPWRRAGIPMPALAAAAVLLLLLVGGGIWYVTRPAVETGPGEGATTVDTSDEGREGRNEASDPPVDPTPPRVEPPPPPPSQVGMAAVTIDASPWANVTITPAGGGKPTSCVTPCLQQLPAGDYNLALENRGVSRPLTERITVKVGEPLVKRYRMPGFDAERAVTSILGASQP